MIIAVTHPQLLGGLPEYMTYLQCAGLPIQCVLDLLYDIQLAFSDSFSTHKSVMKKIAYCAPFQTSHFPHPFYVSQKLVQRKKSTGMHKMHYL